MKRLIPIFLAAALAACSPSAKSSKSADGQIDGQLSKRELRALKQSRLIDSIVMADNFVFKPYDFQMQPAGSPHRIFNAGNKLAVYSDYIDVNLPYFVGITPPYRLIPLNFAITYVEDYRVVRHENGWTITFSSGLSGPDSYDFRLEVVSKTADAELEVNSPRGRPVTYGGTILEN